MPIYLQSQIHWILDGKLNVVRSIILDYRLQSEHGTKYDLESYASMWEMVKNIKEDGFLYILIV